MLDDLIRFPEGKTASLYYSKFREIYENKESENEIVISNTISFDYLPAFSYALHSKSMRKESNLYWSLVEKLVKENYTIYLTDTSKYTLNTMAVEAIISPNLQI